MVIMGSGILFLSIQHRQEAPAPASSPSFKLWLVLAAGAFKKKKEKEKGTGRKNFVKIFQVHEGYVLQELISSGQFEIPCEFSVERETGETGDGA
jgi:hypothetical protein